MPPPRLYCTTCTLRVTSSSLSAALCTDFSSTQNKYDLTKSSTYQKEGKIWSTSYGDGASASGVTGRDIVNLGGLAITNQRIGMAQQESAQFAQGPLDHLLGLGFNTVADTKTPVDSLIVQNLISKPVFGVFLGPTSTGGDVKYVFGGYDASKVSGSFTTAKAGTVSLLTVLLMPALPPLAPSLLLLTLVPV
ncbi:acid protease [Hesseltinella vesiculosa]|uniref:Acid protease n=1 Tax=Hesseltinella vesiculosa TaxID=101127 RepID=A0A1X2G9G4_9FUNG|nr:acid protease [Hesseltinella vesiculosa]